MFYCIDLSFNKGEILTKVMLDELYNFPKELLNTHYDNYKDGILSGTEIVQKDNNIFIKKGIIKYQNKLYRMDHDFNLSAYVQVLIDSQEVRNQKDYKIVLVCEKHNEIDMRKGQVSYLLEPRIYSKSEEVEGIPILFFNNIDSRIKLPHLLEPFDEKELNEYFKASAFSMIQVPYSSVSGITFHPFIFEKINDVLQSKKEKSALDYILINEIISHKVLEIEFIELLLLEFLGKKKWSEILEQEISTKKESILINFTKKIFTINHHSEFCQRDTPGTNDMRYMNHNVGKGI